MRKAIHLFLLLFCWSSTFAKAPNKPTLQELPYYSKLKFIENVGQWESFITHKVSISNGTVFFQKNRMTYHLFDADQNREFNHKRHDGTLSDNDSINLHAFHISFANANEFPRIRGERIHKEYYNYFLGKNPDRWASHVSAYTGIKYKNIYDYVDFKIYEYATTLKYEFVVHPKGDPKDIVLEYDGLDEVYIKNKRLVLKTSVGNIYENKPYVYQIIDNKKIRIDCEFSLNEQKQLSFSIKEKYNKRYPLIIDPEIVFSTYSGSEADNWGNTACYDQDGNLYTGGTVFNDVSDGFPTTIGAFQQQFNINDNDNFENFPLPDIGILKFNSTGTELLYATYIGGSFTDVPVSMITNNANELVILGITGSNDFPMRPNSFDQTFNGGTRELGTYNCRPNELIWGNDYPEGADIILFKLSSTGSNLTASTYLGGSQNDGITLRSSTLCNNYGDQNRGDVIVDDDDNIYIVSSTFSSNFPINAGFDRNYSGSQDGIVVKMNSNLSLLDWSTYLGSTRQDIALSIQLDSEKNVWVTGGTTSSSFPTTNGVAKPTYGGRGDGFIAQIKNDGTQLLQSTFVGTSSFDQNYFIQLDEEENIYVLGQTKGFYPVSNNVYSNRNSGIFIHKFNKQLQSLLSTTIGSSASSTSSITPNISPTAFLVNECNNILLSGWGGATNATRDFRENCGSIFLGYNGGSTDNMPITSNAFQKTTDGSDFYLMVLSENAESLLYGSYFGGPNAAEHVDGGTSRFDNKGIVYQSVCAGCGGFGTGTGILSDFPLHPPQTDSTSYPQYNNSDNCNNAVFKLDLTTLKAEIGIESECSTALVTFQNLSFGSQDFFWDFGDGNTFITESPASFGHFYEQPGEYLVTLIVTDLTTCLKKDTTQITVKVIEANGKNYYDTLCVNEQKEIQIDSFKLDQSYEWSPNTFILSQNKHKATIQPQSSITYAVKVTDSLGCIRTDSVIIKVPQLSARQNPEIIGNCDGLVPKVQFSHQNFSEELFDIEYFWDFGDDETSTLPNPLHQYPSYDTFTVFMSAKFLHCSWDTSYQIPLEEVYVPNVITQNDDKVNDQLIIHGIENSGAWKLEIYNRWGDGVYCNEDYDNTWGPKYLNDGTYYYLLTAPDETTCKGWIQIIR